jgi:hypothetical protein
VSEKFSEERILGLMNASLGYNFGPTEPEDSYEDEYVDDSASDWDELDNDEEDNPTCLCFEGDSPLCGGCDHQLRCFEVDCNYSEHYESDEEWRLHEGVADEDCPCELADDDLEDFCPECYHLVSCEQGEACSEQEFHSSGEPVIDTPKIVEPRHDTDSTLALPARHRTYWTPAEDEQLVRLFNAGWGFPEIAAEHQRTTGSITKRLLMLCFELNGIPIKHDPIEAEKASQPWTQDDDELVTVLHLNGTSLAWLSAALKRSQRAVALRLIYLRLVTTCDLEKVTYASADGSSASSKQNKRWTIAQYVELREAFLQGASLATLAEISGRSIGSCLMVLYHRGEISESDLEKAVTSAQKEISGIS